MSVEASILIGDILLDNPFDILDQITRDLIAGNMVIYHAVFRGGVVGLGHSEVILVSNSGLILVSNLSSVLSWGLVYWH